VNDDEGYRLASPGGQMVTHAGSRGKTSLSSVIIGSEIQRVASGAM
jgi:hypothetical protein